MNTQTNPSFFLILFLSFFFIELLLNFFLDFLNQKSILAHPSLPSFFKDKMSIDVYKKTQEYTSTKLSFNKWNLLFSSFITLIVLFSGLLPWFEDLLTSFHLNPILHGSLFLVTLLLFVSLLNIPLGVYNTFVIEGRFGFNKMTFKLYIQDTLKSALLGFLIGVPFLAVFLWFLNFTGNNWWGWAFLFMTSFQLLMLVLYPTFIAPLFNKFKPLDEGVLKEELLTLAKKTDFTTSGLFVMDGSKRSSHSNAYFTGFGKMRRIVLFDTLIEQMSLDELKSILCHEIGHYKRGHIYKMLFFSLAFQGVGLFILSLAIKWQPLYTAFGFEKNPESLKHVGLFLFMTTFSTFTFFLGPLMNYRSRKHEFEADAFAIENTESPKHMETALLKLAEKNLSNLTPHPWYSAFHYSHPSIYERIKAFK